MANSFLKSALKAMLISTALCAVALPAADARHGGGGGRGGHAGGRAHAGGGAHVSRNVNVNVNRHTNVNVNRRANVNVGRRGGVAVAGRGPVRRWVRRPYYGRIVGGVALGAVIAVTIAGTAPVAPAPNMCWYWSDQGYSQGYWDYCVPE